MPKILIVDDDISIAQLISDALEDEGFETHIETQAKNVCAYVEENKDELCLITLDIMMPDMSGLDICAYIRSVVSCPVIFISAKSNAQDAVLGFETGGDDYIAKPFVVEELVARIKAHLRRESRNVEKAKAGSIKIGDIEIFIDSFEVKKGGKSVAFSTREFQLLQYLMENAGKVLTREQIFSHVWDTEFGDIGTVAVNIKSIRDKIDIENEYIKTVWGVGYKFVKLYK